MVAAVAVCRHQHLLAVDTARYAVESLYLCTDCGDYFDLRLLNTWHFTPADLETTARAMLLALADRPLVLAAYQPISAPGECSTDGLCKATLTPSSAPAAD